ncbi:hypothetical protein [Achromobacter insolitus]|uniref:hypothetical protein n=1 Tax=Achromobacter insolitus TaxID=217204 RepID=UPI0007C39937|nr:hypothetical protein [Achromobacter insolitus]OAD16501.1 hypothetical protein A3839_28555 [Achromobacter insolitus]
MSFDFSVHAVSALRAAMLASLLAAGPAAHAALTPGGLLSQQSSVVAESIKKEAQMCATGEAEGTIGNAIKNALKIHTELAAVGPGLEELFSPVSDCFSGLMGTWDLSFAIPSLASVRDQVKGALTKFAKKKVCSAVDQARGMVTSSINNAISDLTKGTGMGGIGDLNGLSNGLISGALSQIDPDLGRQYTRPPAQTDYTIDVNPFSGTPLDFGGGNSTGGSGGSSGGTGSSGAVGQINTGNSQIGAVNSQLANLQAQVGPALQELSRAQSQLSNCRAQLHSSCVNYELNVTSATVKVNKLNEQIASLRNQLAGASARSAAPASSGSSGGGSVLDRLGSYF